MEKQKTPLCLAIEQFELLKQKSTKLTDVFYLDGVISVLQSLKPTERELIKREQIGFAEWTCGRYIKLHSVWVGIYADQRNKDNWKTTEELLEIYNERKL